MLGLMQSALVNGGDEIGVKGMITEVFWSICKLTVGAIAALLIMVLSSRPLLCQNLPNLVHTTQSLVTGHLNGSGILSNLSSGPSAQVSGAAQRSSVETSGIPSPAGSQMQMPIFNTMSTSLTTATATASATGARQTPLGKVWIIRGADALVTSTDGESQHKLLPLAVRSIASEVVREHPEATLAAMVIIASLLAVLANLARTARMKAEELDVANKRLLGEVNERQLAEEQVRHLNRDLEGRLAEHAMLNRSLQAARDQAFEASRVKSEFVANISHELRTPLSIVLGMNSMLLESDLTAEQRDDVTQVNCAAQSLLAVVNDLLDFSKMEAGKVSLEKLEFSPAMVLSQVVGMCAPAAKDKNVQLISNISEAVPNTVRGDEGKLRQSLLNLLANAAKFTENGKIAIDVRVESESLHTVSVSFSVKDTGIGISPQALKNLFQPFVQADGSSTRKYGGSGLGLSITKRLVELMDGSVHVESRLGEGSHFWMVIPFSKIEATEK